MEFHNNYIGLVEEVLNESKNLSSQDAVKKLEKKVSETISEEVSRRAKYWFAGFVFLVFLISHAAAFLFIYYVFNTENVLIEQGVLSAKDRSITSLTISALIGSSFTEVGAAFYLVARYIFQEQSSKRTILPT